MGRDEGVTQAILGVGAMPEHRDQHLREDGRGVVPIQALEGAGISSLGACYQLLFVVEELRPRHRGPGYTAGRCIVLTAS